MRCRAWWLAAVVVVSGLVGCDDAGDDPDTWETTPCYVDYPCFYGGPSCVDGEPDRIVHFESYSCERVCGSPCSGGGCSSSYETCEAGTVCASGPQERAACVPLDEVCGGVEGRTCPEGMICVYGDHYTDNGSFGDERGPCTTYNRQIYGRCAECVADCGMDPVCGCDGMTWESACAAQAAGVPVAAAGSCQP